MTVLLIIGAILILVGILKLMTRKKEVRRFSNEDINEVLGRKPSSPVCMICRKPRCKNKNNHPPRHVNKAEGYHNESFYAKWVKKWEDD